MQGHNQINIGELDVTGLESLAYRFILERDNAAQNLKMVQEEIAVRQHQQATKPKKETK